MTDSTPALLLPLDLHNPEVANEVADAIRRYHGGQYVPLFRRYPWLRPDDDAPQEASGVAEAVVAALQAADLVFTIPPGRCGANGPGMWVGNDYRPSPYSCDNRAGHTGQHEARTEVIGDLPGGTQAAWDQVIHAEVVEPAESEFVLIEEGTFRRADLPEILARYMRSLGDAIRQERQHAIRLKRLSAAVAEGEKLSGPVGQFADRLRALFLADDADVAP